MAVTYYGLATYYRCFNSMPIQKFGLVFQSADKIAPNVLHLHFTRADGQALDFIPGQFITFLFTSDDGQVKRRSYSVATIPNQESGIQIAVSYVKAGIASEILFHLTPGDQLPAMGPAGRLVLQTDLGIKRHILVGTGTGIAPYRAMLPQLTEQVNQGADVIILQGAQYRDDLLYDREFNQFANSHRTAEFRACLSRESLDDRLDHEYSGYVQKQFAQLQLNPEQDMIYLCGNPNMIDDAFEDLTARGFGNHHIRREKYISSN